MEFPIFEAYTAAILRDHGHSVAVIDAMAEDLSLSSVKKRILSFAPDAVLVETVPDTYQGDLRIADIAKEIDPGIHTIYYGWYATARPGDVLDSQNIDFVVRGEPEYTSLELLNRLEDRANLDDVKGLSFKKNNIAKHNPSRAFIEDLDQLPYPARDLYPIQKYCAWPLGNITTVVANKGCPYHCIYCPCHLMDGSEVRSRSPKNVVDEIEDIVNRFRIRNIFFYADAFTLWGDERIVQFCRGLLERKLDIRWLINSRVDTLPSKNTMEYMAKAGCFLIQFGVESGCLRMLEAMRKGRTKTECERYLDAIEPAIEKTKKAGIFTNIKMIIGFDGENSETVRQSVDLVNRSRPDLPAHFGIVRPYPGTVLGRIAEQKGLLNGKKWSSLDYRWGGPQLYAIINNSDPNKIIELQRMADESVKVPLAHKLVLALRLLRREGLAIFVSIIRSYSARFCKFSLGQVDQQLIVWCKGLRSRRVVLE